eukprot:1166559-Amphidinium_carterae.1
MPCAMWTLATTSPGVVASYTRSAIVSGCMLRDLLGGDFGGASVSTMHLCSELELVQNLLWPWASCPVKVRALSLLLWASAPGDSSLLLWVFWPAAGLTEPSLLLWATWPDMPIT